MQAHSSGASSSSGGSSEDLDETIVNRDDYFDYNDKTDGFSVPALSPASQPARSDSFTLVQKKNRLGFEDSAANFPPLSKSRMSKAIIQPINTSNGFMQLATTSAEAELQNKANNQSVPEPRSSSINQNRPRKIAASSMPKSKAGTSATAANLPSN